MRERKREGYLPRARARGYSAATSAREESEKKPPPINLSRVLDFFFFFFNTLSSSFVSLASTKEQRPLKKGGDLAHKEKRSKNPKRGEFFFLREFERKRREQKKPTHTHTQRGVSCTRIYTTRETTEESETKRNLDDARDLIFAVARARWKSFRPSVVVVVVLNFSFFSLSKTPFLKKAWAQVLEKVSRFTRDLRRASIRRRGKKRNKRNEHASSFRLRLFLPPEIDANVANASKASRFLRLFFCQRGSDIEDFFLR